MTASDHTKVLKQIAHKKGKLEKWKKHNTPKERVGDARKRRCKLCGRMGAHISRYNLHLCRQCFRQYAMEIGFKKYN